MNTYYSSTILIYWFTLIWITAYILACTNDAPSASIDTSEITEEDAWSISDQNTIERDMMIHDTGIAFADVTSPEYCGSCHQSHYEQWQGSMHAYAIRDPIFLALNKKGIDIPLMKRSAATRKTDAVEDMIEIVKKLKEYHSEE